MGIRDGSIIATIITAHIERNDAAAPSHVCPGIRIHAIDIVQPPGIAIPPIADIELDQTMVTVELAAKASAKTPQNARSPARSSAPSCRNRPSRNCAAITMTSPQPLYYVMAAEPGGCLAPSLGRAVEPLAHGPKAVQPAHIGGIGVADYAVLERECARARP